MKRSLILIIIVIIITACGGTRSIEWLASLSFIHHYKENIARKSPNITFVKFNNGWWQFMTYRIDKRAVLRGDNKSNIFAHVCIHSKEKSVLVEIIQRDTLTMQIAFFERRVDLSSVYWVRKKGLLLYCSRQRSVFFFLDNHRTWVRKYLGWSW